MDRSPARPSGTWPRRRALGDPPPAAGRIGDRCDRLDRDGRAITRSRSRRDRLGLERSRSPTVVAARRAPAAAGGPRSAAHLARPTWSRSRFPAGWPLTSPSASGRCGPPAASPAGPTPASPSATPACRTGKAAGRIVAYAAEHGIPPWAQVVDRVRAEEQGLRRLGWRPTYVPTDVLAARLGDFLANLPDPAALVSEQLDDALVRGVRARAGRTRPTRAAAG